jgi:hypothetical protein
LAARCKHNHCSSHSIKPSSFWYTYLDPSGAIMKAP